jgi:carbon-monoxide dehydrogenase medium subunit
MSFEYLEPETIEEATALLNQFRKNAKVIAGGTDLVAKIKENALSSGYLISIEKIDEMRGIVSNQNGIVIKAATTIRDILHTASLSPSYNLLIEAARELADPSVRNMATIGGNICDAAPSADMVPPLIALSASVQIVTIDSERVIPLEKFFTGPYSTVMKEKELLTQILVPHPSENQTAIYLKHHMKGGKGLGSIGVAIAMDNNPEDHCCQNVKIVLGAAAPSPMRAVDAEGMIRGKQVTPELVEKVAQKASLECNPRDSIRGSAEYKRVLVRSLVKQALNQISGFAEPAYFN